MDEFELGIQHAKDTIKYLSDESEALIDFVTDTDNVGNDTAYGECLLNRIAEINSEITKQQDEISRLSTEQKAWSNASVHVASR